ncbi:colicin-like pore-forming protein [Escherichia coli]|nr:colicin-like pore-forming protein [Escherichia coli]
MQENLQVLLTGSLSLVRVSGQRTGVLFVKTEAIIAGNAATALVALVFSILTGSALGIIGYGLLMAVTGALIDESLVEKANKFWGI